MSKGFFCEILVSKLFAVLTGFFLSLSQKHNLDLKTRSFRTLISISYKVLFTK